MCLVKLKPILFFLVNFIAVLVPESHIAHQDKAIALHIEHIPRYHEQIPEFFVCTICILPHLMLLASIRAVFRIQQLLKIFSFGTMHKFAYLLLHVPKLF